MHSAEPTGVAYLVRKIVWRGWIRSLSWLRRHHVLPA
jgi:hypothetical protein